MNPERKIDVPVNGYDDVSVTLIDCGEDGIEAELSFVDGTGVYLWHDEREDLAKALTASVVQPAPAWLHIDGVTEHNLQHFIDTEQPMVFTYTGHTSDDQNVRWLSPWRLFDGPNGRMLIGYDHKREAPRQFFVEKIKWPKASSWKGTDDYVPEAAPEPDDLSDVRYHQVTIYNTFHGADPDTAAFTLGD